MPLSNERSPTIGIDFGTTNSALALARPASAPEIASFSTAAGATESYRSVLYLERTKKAAFAHTRSFTGPHAIERYLQAEEKGRLIQSLKSHLTSRSLTGTEIFGRRYTLEELISRILADLRTEGERQFGHAVRHAVVGRPVRFVGSESDDDDTFAVSRLRDAFQKAGFESTSFLMEPVAAAYAYESPLDHDELILIGDFGGGTSDFSLLRVGPGVRRRGRTPEDLLGNSGVGLAGDAFDARIVRKLVSPALGADSFGRSLGKVLPAVPAWIYANLERWHYLSFLRTRSVMEMLKSAHARALEPEKIAALINLIDEDLGFQLHQAVQRLKMALSHAQSADFRFRDGSVEMTAHVKRADFEEWIADELMAIEHAVDALFSATGTSPRDVDRVFLTGGTSFVPAVRRIFEVRVGADRVRTGNEFTSVVHGLALFAAEKAAAAH